MLRSLRPLDWAAVAIALLSIVVISDLVYAGPAGKGPSSVGIQTAEGRFVYPLAKDRVLTFTGPIGKTVVRIQNNSVQVLSDPGPQQIFVKQGAISRSGDWLACLPNKIFVKTSGQPAPSAVDAKTY